MINISGHIFKPKNPHPWSLKLTLKGEGSRDATLFYSNVATRILVDAPAFRHIFYSVTGTPGLT
ncbi:hypothetical protein COY20_03095 [Candidatus Shapirobacteria bacterium CG_4_10_14_0_2_um_filter_40_12]|uniref:Uncharacterized protein n=1 Tax=Candidatus Shapirobacteria bacterium CG_4_10_14_0_2_um_filter_40_12 TaxID=1974871 RepID=A0A2M7TSL4_9BACT|nr:MAG: hypothetical protein COY20_03095 [Candidatus Shapirobacteria bacterium CG_4_10_14_0_2_um_filter_40_12]